MPEGSNQVPSIAEVLSSDWLRTGYRTGRPYSNVAARLGLLTEFQGIWRGTGFNLIARPFFKKSASEPVSRDRSSPLRRTSDQRQQMSCPLSS